MASFLQLEETFISLEELIDEPLVLSTIGAWPNRRDRIATAFETESRV